MRLRVPQPVWTRRRKEKLPWPSSPYLVTIPTEFVMFYLILSTKRNEPFALLPARFEVRFTLLLVLSFSVYSRRRITFCLFVVTAMSSFFSLSCGQWRVSSDSLLSPLMCRFICLGCCWFCSTYKLSVALSAKIFRQQSPRCILLVWIVVTLIFTLVHLCRVGHI